MIVSENSEKPQLETMGTRCKVIMLLFIICSFICCCIVTFYPQNTQFQESKPPSSNSWYKSISHRAQFKHFTQLNSFALFSIEMSTYSLITQNINVNTTGIIRFYDENEKIIRSHRINTQDEIKCAESKCDEIFLYKTNNIDFESASLVLTTHVSDSSIEFNKFSITSTSLRTSISIDFFFFISFVTICTSVSIYVIIRRRQYPSGTDQWLSVILFASLALIDGPWLMGKFYSSRFFSSFYDVSPELFHIVYILFLMAFFASNVSKVHKKIFESWILNLFFVIGLSAIIIMQLFATDFLPQSLSPVFISETKLFIPLIVVTAAVHVVIISIMALGLITTQISDNLATFILILVTTLVEALDIVRYVFRFYSPRISIGYVFASDFLYITFANSATIIFVLITIPLVNYESLQEENYNENVTDSIELNL